MEISSEMEWTERLYEKRSEPKLAQILSGQWELLVQLLENLWS